MSPVKEPAMKRIFPTIALALLSSCVASGAKVTEAQLIQFQKGSTTIAQVEQALGAPTSSTLLPNGSHMLMYFYVQAQARPASFIPIIGPLVGGSDSKSNSATLTFDNAGILVSYSASSSSFGTGMGAASGTAIEQTPQQPRQAPPSP
jgi:outer membrane protein assembly factor BamE (lipoprotein component of BamABCDE complex)